MKKQFKSTLFLMTILTIFTVSSQVDTNAIISTKYADFYEYNSLQDEYIHDSDSSGWLDVEIIPYDDYYTIEINNDGEKDKIWWEHSNETVDGFDEDSHDIYYTEDGRKIIFYYDDQEILFFYDLSEIQDQYLKLMTLSKIETYEK